MFSAVSYGTMALILPSAAVVLGPIRKPRYTMVHASRRPNRYPMGATPALAAARAAWHGHTGWPPQQRPSSDHQRHPVDLAHRRALGGFASPLWVALHRVEPLLPLA